MTWSTSRRTGKDALARGSPAPAGRALEAGGEIATEVVKNFLFHRDGTAIETEYDIFNRSPAESRFWFGVELSLTLPGAEESLHSLFLSGGKGQNQPLNQGGVIPETGHLGLRDDSTGFTVSLETAPDCEVWHFPLETVSQSERGLEKTGQGNVLLFSWRFSLRPGERKKFFFAYCAKAWDNNLILSRRIRCPNCGRIPSRDGG